MVIHRSNGKIISLIYCDYGTHLVIIDISLYFGIKPSNIWLFNQFSYLSLSIDQNICSNLELKL